MEKLALTDPDAACFIGMVRKVNFFASINPDLLDNILKRISVYRCKAGEKVCRQGDRGDIFYIVGEGKVRVYVSKALLFSQTLAHLVPGDCFGEMALLTGEPRNATVVCVEDSRIFALTVNSFHQMLLEHPAFAQEIKKLAADREFELHHEVTPAMIKMRQ